MTSTQTIDVVTFYFNGTGVHCVVCGSSDNQMNFLIILMGKRDLIAMLNLSSWCLVVVERLFLAVPRGCLQFVIVVFPGHTHLLL